MSKTLTSGMRSMLASGAATLEWCATFTRTDGQVLRFTSGMRDVVIDGLPYQAAPGFTVSNITCTLGFQVDTLQMTVLASDDLTRADFLTGRWDRCRVDFAQYNWADAGSPSDGFILWPSYRVANVEPIQAGFVLELRDLRQLLQQDYTRSDGKTCPYRLGDSRCTVVLAGSPTGYIFPFTVTSVTSRSLFTASGLAQAADYFSNGIATFATGLHADLPLLVRDHTAGGVIHLAVPLIADIAPGQTGTIVAGCLKRFEDCRDKFANVLNFGGHKDIPSTEELVGQ